MRSSGERLHRIALAAGGTGGHVYPALAVLQALLARSAVEEVLFFGRHEGWRGN
jgi:UDP-N-acetylglucosamine--N-acetylmuramyl-(pentapeptide) pyrophosphoryl-undecaprenol N-acetylglucosamine transferase